MNEQIASQRQTQDLSTRLLLGIIVVTVFTTTFTGSMMNILIPTIRAEFAASPADISWIVTGYMLAYAIGVPLYGSISDVFGLRNVFIFGLIGFAVGGIIAAVAPSLLLVVIGRLVQGIGGAAVPALASIAIVRTIPAGNRGGALGLVASSVGVGSSVGPIIGGTLGGIVGWRLLFVLSGILMIAAIPFALRILSNERPETRQRFDLLGGILLGLSVGLFLFGITQSQAENNSSWLSFLGAVLSAICFIWWIYRTEEPFVSPKLFANGGYRTSLIVGFINMFAFSALLVFLPLLIIEVNQLTPAIAGLLITPSALAMAFLSPITGKLSDRWGPRLPIQIGISLMIFASLYLSTLAGVNPLWISLGVALAGAGISFVQSPLNNATANTLDQHDLSAGMGLFTGISFLGSGSGPALIGTFLASRQRLDTEAINPLNSFGAAAFSDAFLVIGLVLILGLWACFGLATKK